MLVKFCALESYYNIFCYTLLLQGYLPVEALVLDIEAWGLGGNKAREIQQAYQKREELFTNQRRKVNKKHQKIITSIMQSTKVFKFDTFVLSADRLENIYELGRFT